MKPAQLLTAVVLLVAVAFQPSRTLSNSSVLGLEDDFATSTSSGSSWVPVSSPVLRQKSRTLDLDDGVDDHQYEDVDIVTAPPKLPDTFSFVVASDFGGNSGGSSGGPSSRSRNVPDDHPEEEVELVTASEWFSDWDAPAKLLDTTTTRTTTARTTTARTTTPPTTTTTPPTTTTTTAAARITTTAKSPRRALPKILIRRRLPSRARTTTRPPLTTISEVPLVTPSPTTTTTTVQPSRTTTFEPTKRTTVEPTITTTTRQLVVSFASTRTPRTTSTTIRTIPVVTPPTTAPTTSWTPYRTFVNRYGTFSDKDNTILKPFQRDTTVDPGLPQGPPSRNGTRKINGGFVAVPATKTTKIKTGIRSGREFQDREERQNTVPASTSNAEKLSYILVGVCCAVSITCLIVVVTVLRCRKTRQRQRALEQLQESRNLTVSWLEKTHHAYGPGLPPVPGTPGRKNTNHRTTDPSSQDVTGTTQRPQNLWFVRRDKLPFLLYDHHGPGTPEVSRGPDVSPDQVPDGGSSSLGRNLRYQNNATGHTSGLDCAKKGELIYWSSNNEQLI